MLALSNAMNRCGEIYDAIIVDEAQGFADDFWLPVEMLLTDPETGLLYIFLDENQDIFRRSVNIPVPGERMFSIKTAETRQPSTMRLTVTTAAVLCDDQKLPACRSKSSPHRRWNSKL